MGWLTLVNGEFQRPQFSDFLGFHPHEYQLRRVEEVWFKGLLFPAFNSVGSSSILPSETGVKGHSGPATRILTLHKRVESDPAETGTILGVRRPRS